jgi:hypothetical protein
MLVMIPLGARPWLSTVMTTMLALLTLAMMTQDVCIQIFLVEEITSVSPTIVTMKPAAKRRPLIAMTMTRVPLTLVMLKVDVSIPKLTVMIITRAQMMIATLILDVLTLVLIVTTIMRALMIPVTHPLVASTRISLVTTKVLVPPTPVILNRDVFILLFTVTTMMRAPTSIVVCPLGVSTQRSTAMTLMSALLITAMHQVGANTYLSHKQAATIIMHALVIIVTPTPVATMSIIQSVAMMLMLAQLILATPS